MSRLSRPVVSLIGGAMLLVSACDGHSGAAASSQSQALRLYDFGFDMPDEISGRLVDLQVANDGSVAHEFAVARIKPGTTVEQVLEALHDEDEAPPDFMLGDPGGVNLLGPGEQLRYQRVLEPGTYMFFCPLPLADGSSHSDHGMAKVFEVTDVDDDALPDAALTFTLGDDAITPPKLKAGTTSYAINNTGTIPHEVYIAGVPSARLTSTTTEALTEQIGTWIEGGQVGPPPMDVHFPGGHQSIAPGDTVVLTLTLRPGHTYQLEDYSGEQPITAQATTP